MAVSIPIFTAQLKKARLATNQANARAAYAAATTAYMLKYADNAPDKDYVSYTYTNKEGTVGTATEADASAAKLTETNISSWETTTKTETEGTLLGDKTATKWTVVLSKDGGIVGFTADFSTK